MHRLFVAIRPPVPIRTLVSGVMEGVPGARWQNDDQLHLTLRYIGEVNSRTADDIASALRSVQFSPFEIRLSGAGEFQSRAEGRPLWVGVTPSQPLMTLHKKVDRALTSAGLESEHRAYMPHVTVARLGRLAGDCSAWIASNGSFLSPFFTVADFALYESHMGHGGSHYEALMHVAAVR